MGTITIIERGNGDLFNCGANILVNATNCVGVMGGGIALEFKNRYPSMFEDYVEMCQRGIEPGITHLHYPEEDENITVLNVATKKDVKNPSEMSFVIRGLTGMLNTLVAIRPTHAGQTVALPALGCGLGGLDWNDVKPLILKLCEHPLLEEYNFIIFEPQN